MFLTIFSYPEKERIMIKKILKIFKRRDYVSLKQRKLSESDLKRELEDTELETTNQYMSYRRKNFEIQVLIEILEESDVTYSESEINSIFLLIEGEPQKK